jgi:ATP/maltotriose-dependent transcriptional regulator MalT/DNA-binding SARP family transcriptional activator
MQRSTPLAKLLPPAIPSAWVDRPGLRARLDDGAKRRLTTVVAGAGYGKSSLLASWAAATRPAWYSLQPEDTTLAVFVRGLVDALRLRLPALESGDTMALDWLLGPEADDLARADDLAANLAETLERHTGELVVILDDVQELAWGSPPARLVEGLCRHAPPNLHLVLAARTEPPFPIERLRGRGQVLDLDAGLLAFDRDEVAELASTLGDGGEALGAALHRITGGWPAATCLALEWLRGRPPSQRAAALAELRRPGGLLATYLVEEVMSHAEPLLRDLVMRVAPFERFSVTLCRALGVDIDAAGLARFARRGLFLAPSSNVEGWFRLSDLVREVTLASMPLSETELRTLHKRAAAWFEAEGLLEEALASVVAVGGHLPIAEFLAEHGSDLVAAGGAAKVVAAAGAIPPTLRDAVLDQVEGQARQVGGDWTGALARFTRSAGDADPLPTGLAWRMGLIHHLRGDLDKALSVYARGEAGQTGRPTPDAAILDAWIAAARWLRGEAEACRAAATRALATATKTGDDRALAAAHTAMALLAALEGDRGANDAHHLRALQAAERAGDVLAQIRIRTNRGSRCNEEGFYGEALAELEIAIRLAELTGYAAILGLALVNRGDARLGLGQLDEAIADYEAAKASYERLGSRYAAYPLLGLGDAYRLRGDVAQARAAYQESIALSEPAGDVQGLVPAYAGLARVLVAEDPDVAMRLARQAVDHGPGMGFVAAQLAAGWVALAVDDRARAADRAIGAAETAAARRDRAGLAEALELRAMAGPAPDPVGLLREARSIWAAIGDRVGAARNRLALARFERNGDEDPALAEQRLAGLGVGARAAEPAGLLRAIAPVTASPVRIEALGGFRVLRQGVAVRADEWQSRKARDLLKLLVARRGRPTPRELAAETLWPDDDPAKVSARLSVALSTARTVLDPEKRFPAEHFVAADRDTIWLDTIEVDVEVLLTTAGKGLAAEAAGRTEEALDLLTAVEAAYAGEFLEGDPYEDWTLPLREEARAAAAGASRALARLAAGAGRHDHAIRHHLRVLERDAYDEDAHLGLVRVLSQAGRHGEARRRYRVYTDRMRELDIEPAPFPGPGSGGS